MWPLRTHYAWLTLHKSACVTIADQAIGYWVTTLYVSIFFLMMCKQKRVSISSLANKKKQRKKCVHYASKSAHKCGLCLLGGLCFMCLPALPCLRAHSLSLFASLLWVSIFFFLFTLRFQCVPVETVSPNEPACLPLQRLLLQLVAVHWLLPPFSTFPPILICIQYILSAILFGCRFCSAPGNQSLFCFVRKLFQWSLFAHCGHCYCCSSTFSSSSVRSTFLQACLARFVAFNTSPLIFISLI